MSESPHISQQKFAPELVIGSIHFTDYDPHLAKRSVSIMRSELSRALSPDTALQTLHTQSRTAPLSLHLTERDFSSPERLGKALASSILKQLGL